MLQGDYVSHFHLKTGHFLMFQHSFNLFHFKLFLMELDEGDVEQLGIRETVMRRQLPLTQRARPAGCRNFFWKTFTSC
uniref:Somatostatin/Cortistatin C-terminal domain-containing protein n=1 Tax=Neogobius melanostomus TaxID=47308 RepID=A0A8C6SNM9_9GOBI